MTTYPTADMVPFIERKRMGIDGQAIFLGHYQPTDTARIYLRAVKTGEFRPPKMGEWYLSGAIIEAYRATEDLTQSYQIARLVKVELSVVERIIE